MRDDPLTLAVYQRKRDGVRRRRASLFSFFLVTCHLSLVTTEAADRPLRVVATLLTFADLTKTIGGDHVEVSAVASPKFNPHFIEPKPSNVLKVKRADVFVHAGLDLELWRWPLVDAAGNREVMPGAAHELDLSRGISLLEVPDRPLSRAEGDIHLYGNPHYWLHPENARVMAQAIAAKLSELDPAHAPVYHERLEGFLKSLDAHISQWQTQLASLRGKEALAYHRSWPYLAQFAGIRVEQFLEPKPGIPPTPRQLAFLEQYVAQRHIPAILQESFVPKEAGRALERRTGLRVVTLCQNVGELPEASDYLAMMDYNVRQLTQAMGEPHS